MRNGQARFVEWNNQSCVIRFKTAQPGGAPLDLHSLLRSREPISRSKMTIRGKVPDLIHDCTHHCESHNEVKAVQILVAAAHAEVFKVQPLEVLYQVEGKRTRYFPDILLKWGNEIWVVEVKDDKKADSPKEQIRFAKLKELLLTHNLNFILWKKSSICAEPRLANARIVLRYQTCRLSAFEREHMRRKFAETPETTLNMLSDDEVRAAFRLVMDGILHVDWWEPLRRSSIISAHPVGHQEWPSRTTEPTY